MKIGTITIPRDISILLALTITLSVLRVIFFDTSSLVYLLWNIFLALVPFAISSILLVRAKEGRLGMSLLGIGGIIWLLFIPNAPYIVTDLIHLVHTKMVPTIYDTFLLFTSAWVGLLFFFHSLSHMEQIAQLKYSPKFTRSIIIVTTIIISFGMYLGRFLRFNSWDIFANPTSLYGGVSNTLSSSSTSEAFIFIALSSIFLSVGYMSWKYGKIRD